uniref:(northern house mosquito) hypothetical protein n=2 Tax=Culex pipiens TaxID=7175 RepID=A0A8D8L065_CULPI
MPTSDRCASFFSCVTTGTNRSDQLSTVQSVSATERRFGKCANQWPPTPLPCSTPRRLSDSRLACLRFPKPTAGKAHRRARVRSSGIDLRKDRSSGESLEDSVMSRYLILHRLAPMVVRTLSVTRLVGVIKPSTVGKVSHSLARRISSRAPATTFTRRSCIPMASLIRSHSSPGSPASSSSSSVFWAAQMKRIAATTNSSFRFSPGSLSVFSRGQICLNMSRISTWRMLARVRCSRYCMVKVTSGSVRKKRFSPQVSESRFRAVVALSISSSMSIETLQLIRVSVCRFLPIDGHQVAAPTMVSS